MEVALAQGRTAKDVRKQMDVTEQTDYCGREEYGGLKIGQAKRLRTRARERSAEEEGGGAGDRHLDSSGGRRGQANSGSVWAREWWRWRASTVATDTGKSRRSSAAKARE